MARSKLLVLLVVLGGCTDPTADLPAPVLPDGTLDYTPALPDHFLTDTLARFDNTPADNPTTDAGATLGRVLFYDRRLSANGETSCASCHDPAVGFSDPRTRSLGFDGGETRRHSMQLINLRWYARAAMFWDERAATLEDQVLVPVQDDVEMGLSLEELVARVRAADYYGPLFTAAFGSNTVDETRIARALAQFVRSIVSYQSRWDEGVGLVGGDIAQDFPNYTAEENRGKDIFFGQHDPNTRGLCGTCHLMGNPLAFVPGGGPGGPPGAPPGGAALDNTAVFFMVEPANNGLIDDTDDGYGEVTELAENLGEFKAPSLRNIALTAPYMHDGRFATLEEVVSYYDSGVQAHPNLDPALSAGPGGAPMRLNLTAADRVALVAFLRTLTDDTLATDPRWADPFPASE
ncbi:MAG: cytochrome-c peroxidase [Myxococcales bacterium]|nr:cytochrome-c peroxidase [Myxococcales bacterium]